MVAIGRRSLPPNRKSQIYMADFLRPEVEFRHVCESSVSADTARRRNSPARFLEHLAMKCADGGFAGVDPSAGELEFRYGLGLMGKENVPVPRQNGIDTRSVPVSDLGSDGFSVPPDHGCGSSLLPGIGRGMPAENP